MHHHHHFLNQIIIFTFAEAFSVWHFMHYAVNLNGTNVAGAMQKDSAPDLVSIN